MYEKGGYCDRQVGSQQGFSRVFKTSKAAFPFPQALAVLVQLLYLFIISIGVSFPLGDCITVPCISGNGSKYLKMPNVTARRVVEEVIGGSGDEVIQEYIIAILEGDDEFDYGVEGSGAYDTFGDLLVSPLIPAQFHVLVCYFKRPIIRLSQSSLLTFCIFSG